MANWRVSTYHKKSCEEHEHFVKDGMTIVCINGFRWASFFVETTDDNPPEFEFVCTPGGDDNKDSINMYDCYVNNIESVELDTMDDGWYGDIRFPEDMDEDEQEQLQELIDEHGVYEALEEQQGWTPDETEAWIWGPILIEDAQGNKVRIIRADDDGNMIDFKENE